MFIISNNLIMIFSVPDLVSMKIYLFLEVLFGGRKNGEATRIWQIDTTLLQNPMVCISVYLFMKFIYFFLSLFIYLFKFMLIFPIKTFKTIILDHLGVYGRHFWRNNT